MLVDKVVITVKAGNGGNGAATFKRNAQTAKGGPDGGNGGNGGNVYFQGSPNISDFTQFRFRKKITADDGIKGKKNNLFGKNAADITVLVPLGTEIVDAHTREKVGSINTQEKILIAQGGTGGRGNNEFKTATNQTPLFAEKGGIGEEKILELDLKTIADIGFVGLPNSGKSTLLSLLTNAKPKVGNYPFTTLYPNLGISGDIIIADIPGIIQGASKGKGLGIQFLKHIEKTKILVYCIDCTDKSPYLTYSTIRNEFAQYNTTLNEKLDIILLTKSDLLDDREKLKKQKEFKGKKILFVSQYDEKSYKNLEKVLSDLLQSLS